MENKHDNKASDIVFSSVYKISEDMLRLVHDIVGSHNTFEKDFTTMAEQLEDVTANLQSHLINNKWMSKKETDACLLKIEQAKYLIDMCLGYSTCMREMGNRMISITENLEDDKDMEPITQNLIRFMEKDQQPEGPAPEPEDDPSDD